MVHHSFPDRLRALMEERGWTIADLSRHVFGTQTDERGYTVPKGRQSISRYLNRKAKPSDKTVRLIARRLRVDVRDLDPDAPKANTPSRLLDIQIEPGGKARLYMDIVVPHAVALEVARMLEEYIE